MLARRVGIGEVAAVPCEPTGTTSPALTLPGLESVDPNRLPELIAAAVYVDSGPRTGAPGPNVEGVEMPLPSREELEEEENLRRMPLTTSRDVEPLPHRGAEAATGRFCRLSAPAAGRRGRCVERIPPPGGRSPPCCSIRPYSPSSTLAR